MRVFLLVIAAAACSGGPPAPNPAACKAQSGELATYLRGIDHASPVHDGGVDLVKHDSDPPPPDRFMPAVAITATELRFDGKTGTVAELSERLAQLRGGMTSGGLVLAIDARAPWASVVAVLHAGHAAGFDAPVFLFTRTPRGAAPPRTAIEGKVEAIERDHPTEVGARVWELVKEVTRSCPDLREAYEHADGLPVDVIITGTEEALVACGCTIDMAALRSLLWKMLGTTRPITARDLLIGPAGTRIALPADMPWREAEISLTGYRIPSPAATTIAVWPVVEGS